MKKLREIQKYSIISNKALFVWCIELLNLAQNMPLMNQREKMLEIFSGARQERDVYIGRRGCILNNIEK